MLWTVAAAGRLEPRGEAAPARRAGREPPDAARLGGPRQGAPVLALDRRPQPRPGAARRGAPAAHVRRCWKRLRSRWWALVLPLSIVVVIAAVALRNRPSPDFLTYLALVAVPPLAAAALACDRPRRPAAAGAAGRAALRPRLGRQGHPRRPDRRAGALGARLRQPRLAARLRRPRPLAEARDLRDGGGRRLAGRLRPAAGPERGHQHRGSPAAACRACSSSPSARP